MNRMIPFDFNGHDVRTFTRDGTPWLVAADVARVLEYDRPRDMYRLLADDEKGAHSVRTPGGDQQMTTINEPGLYRAIFSSRSAKSEPFRRWVFHDVLPALRHTGHYAVKDSHLDRELQTCSVDYAHLREPLMGRRGISREEDKLLQGFDQAMQAAGLPTQFKGVAPDPAIYRVTPALARVAIEFLAVGKEVGRVEAARERLAHLCTGRA